MFAALGILGLLLVFLEFFVPGGIFAILGAALLFVSVIVLYFQTESLAYVFGYLFLMILLVIATCKFAIYLMPKLKGASYISGADQEGYFASEVDKNLIGQEALVKHDLKPCGQIEIDGSMHEAESQSGYLKPGTRVKIIGAEGSTYKVQKIEEEKS